MTQERLTGPFSGYFVASYAANVGEMGRQFVGYFRISSQAHRFWETSDTVLDGCCEIWHPDVEAALHHAEAVARKLIAASLPDAVAAEEGPSRGWHGASMERDSWTAHQPT